MGEQIWIKNLKLDIDKISNYVSVLNEYIEHISKRNYEYVKVHASILRQFVDTLDSIVVLLNSNYKSHDEFITGKINNVSGIFILLRKLIESNMIMNIVINNGKDLYDLYLEQAELDEAHISKMFKDSSVWFKQGKKETNKKYYWISKSLKKNVNSIDDLIDLAHITADAKANMKAWVKECNYMSHPTLYSNDKILAPFNGAFIFELYYVFEILIEMMGTFYEIIKAIESIDQFNSSFDIKLIENTIPRFFIFQDDFNQFDRTPKEIVSDFSPIDYNQNPYNIRAEYSMLNIGITAPHIKNGFGERKKTTIGKLIDILAEDIRDLLIGYYHKKDFIFYPKIRQVLEDVSYIDQILKMDETKIEVFQCYMDIQRYNKADYVIRMYKGIYEPGFDHKKMNMVGIDKITTEQYYQKNLNFYKEYFSKNYNVRIKVDKIKQPNSWLFDGKTIPSNWQIIKNMIEDNQFLTKVDSDFFNGLYSLSSLLCHVNHFGVNSKIIKEDKTYIETLKQVMIVVERNFNKLMSYTPQEFKDIFKNHEMVINKLLFNLYNYDIINVPNPD